MTEIAKTVLFVVVGVAALGGALLLDYANRPSQPAISGPIAAGEPLFEDFEPLKVTELEVVEWDEETGTPRFFKVAQVNNVWSIPSHSNYPADADEQLAEAATSVMGLDVVSFESDSPGEFSEYGVVDPADKDLKPGTAGVGTRVVMKNKDGEELVALVIGKEVPDRSELHYVRKIGQDPVYTVKVDPGKLSTKFQDWIEEDLLKLSTWDIKQIRVLDYSYDELARAPRMRGQFAVEYNDRGDTRWELLEGKALNAETGKWTDRTLGDDEELDAEKLNDMKNALDDLKIVDVARKPAGLSANLRSTGALELDQEARVSLARKGFHLVPFGRNQVELLSKQGEARVVMKDGVQYTLRFGEIVEDTSGGEEPPVEAEAEGEEDAEDSGADLNRYIFVMAEFNPDIIPKPELEPLPELSEGAGEDAGEGGAAEEAAAGENGAEEKAGAEEDAAVEDAASEKSSGDEAGAPGEPGPEGQPGEEADGETPEGAEQPAGDAADAPPDAPAEEPAKTAEEIKRERERIEKENQRKQDEYQRKLEEGKKKVDELNARFADWYYVIPDDVYQKIHLSFDQIVKEKEKEDEDGEGDAAGAAAGFDAGAAAADDTGAAVDAPGDESPTGEPETVLDELGGLEKEGPGGSEN